MTIFLHYVWLGPLQTVVVVYLVWKEIGVSALFGLLIIIINTASQSLIGKRFGKIRFVYYIIIKIAKLKLL